MLDNFTPEDTRAGVDMIDGRAIVASTMTVERVPEVALTGVDGSCGRVDALQRAQHRPGLDCR